MFVIKLDVNVKKLSAGGNTMNLISTKVRTIKLSPLQRCVNCSTLALEHCILQIKELLFPIRRGQHRLFTKSDRGRMKLIMQGKDLTLAWKIRQLLNLYNFGDHRTRQIKETYQLGLKRLCSMEQQKKS